MIILNPRRLKRRTYSALLVVPIASSSSRRECGRNISAANNRRSYGQAMRIAVLSAGTFVRVDSVAGSAFFVLTLTALSIRGDKCHAIRLRVADEFADFNVRDAPLGHAVVLQKPLTYVYFLRKLLRSE